MNIVRIICNDIQERLFWTKNLRFIGESALVLTFGMVLVGFVEKKLSEKGLQRLAIAVVALVVGIFVYRSYRAFRERLRADVAGQLERLNPEFEDRFATLAHLEGMTLDAEQKRIYEAIAIQVAPRMKMMRRQDSEHQGLLGLLIACVFLMPASFLFPGTRNAVWRLMNQLDQVQRASGPKILKPNELVKEPSRMETLGEVVITKPDQRVSMSLYETADVAASVNAEGEVTAVRARFWKNGTALPIKSLEWPANQRVGEVNFTIFPEDYEMDLLDVLAYDVSASIRSGSKEGWVQSKVHVVEIKPFAKDREQLQKKAKDRDLRALDDLSTVIREQACLSAELQRAVEEKKRAEAKRSESGGKSPDSKKSSEERKKSSERLERKLAQLKEASRKQQAANERAGKSCPNGSSCGNSASDAVRKSGNGNAALADGDVASAEQWQRDALRSLTEARKQLMDSMMKDARNQDEGSDKMAKAGSGMKERASGSNTDERERPQSSGTASGGVDGGPKENVSSDGKGEGKGESKGESKGGGKGGDAMASGSGGGAKVGELGRRGSIRHAVEEAQAAVNEYLNRPEQELLNVPPKASSASESARPSGWQSMEERMVQEAKDAAKLDARRSRDEKSRQNRELRRERLEGALEEIERHLDVLEQNGQGEKAASLRAMLPEEDRRELERRPKLGPRSAIPFHERPIAESAQRVSESIARRMESGRALSPEQLEALRNESGLGRVASSPQETGATGKPIEGPAAGSLRPGLGELATVDRSTTEGKVDRNQVEISSAVKVKKAGEDESAEVDRVPISFRSRVERYFRKLATE